MKTIYYKSIISVLVIALFLVPSFVTGNPSGQTTSIEGGGFCSDSYVDYNNTAVDNLLYAIDCSTGINVCVAQNDFGALFTCETNLMKSGSYSIMLRKGMFNVITTVNYNGLGFLRLSGTQPTQPDTPLSTQVNGTVLVARTNGMTMIECSAGHTTDCIGDEFSHFSLDAHSLASVGIDFSMTETSTNDKFLDMRVGSDGGAASTGFTNAFILNGDEDSQVERVNFDGCGPNCFGAAQNDISWNTATGNVEVIGDYFGGSVNLQICSQQVSVFQSTFNTMKIICNGGGPGSGQVVSIKDDYIANNQGTSGVGVINLNTHTITSLDFSGNYVLLTTNFPMFGGTGTVTTSNFDSNTFVFGAGSNWNLNAATLSFQSSCGINSASQGHCNAVASGSAPTNFPFTISSGTF